MYWYAYRWCKQKLNIIEDFDMNEDFVIDDERVNLKDLTQGDS